MDLWMNVEEVAKLEGLSERAVRKRLDKAAYSKCRQIHGANGGGDGGKIWQIHLSSLSPPAQAAAVRKKLGSQDQASPESPAPEKLLGILTYNRAKDSDRELAHIRQEILSAYLSATSGKRRIPQDEWCDLYNQGLIRTVKPDVFQQVPKVSVPSLHRWKIRAEQKGLGGLVRKREKKHPTLSMNETQQKWIIARIKNNPDIRPVRVQEFFLQEFGEAPHFSTVFRFMENWKRENEQLYEYLRDPSSWKNKYQVAIGDCAADVTRFCQRWEADSTPADIICSDGKRYAGIGMIDVFSRLPRVLITESSKSLGIAAVLRRGFIDFGIPEVLIKDHGQDYDSKHMQAVCSAFAIDTPWIPVKTPEAKPFIERFWGTISAGLFEELPGYCGHNVAQAQAIRERKKPKGEFCKRGAVVEVALSRDELQQAIDKWIELDYSQRAHEGLDGLRPAEMPARSPAPVRKIEDERVLDILLAPAIPRVIQKKGIEFDCGWYRSLDQGQYVGQKVLVRPDLTDASRVYVFDRHNKYLFTAADKNLDGLTPIEIATAKKRQKKAIRAAARALGEVKTAIEDNSILGRLEGLGLSGKAIVPIIRTEEHDAPAVAQAKRAVADQVSISRPVSEEELAEQISRIESYQSPPDLDEERFRAQVEEIKRREAEMDRSEILPAAGNDQVSPAVLRFPVPPKRPIFKTSVDRYKWLIEQEASGVVLSGADEGFARGYEAGMDEATADYWRTYKAMLS